MEFFRFLPNLKLILEPREALLQHDLRANQGLDGRLRDLGLIANFLAIPPAAASQNEQAAFAGLL